MEDRALLAATVIDVMVLYSTDARARFANSDAAIQRAIRQSVDIANLAHLNTQDNIVMRLVHTAHLAYSNPDALTSVQLAALEANPVIPTMRAGFGADLVCMVVDSAQMGGLGDTLINPAGDQTQAFSVVSWDAIGHGGLTFAHETGHNLGAGHERDNPSQYAQGVFPGYSFGYHTIGQNGTDYGDAMSYQGRNLPVFAWPGYSWQGAAIGSDVGNADAADLRTTFLATGPLIAAYRPTIVADAAPTAVVIQTDLLGDQLTFQVRYHDDITINASTIGNGDVFVTTPEGFKLAAEFVSINTSGDAYAITATYRATLPTNLPALSSLTFGHNANQVKDSNNAFVAAGTIAQNLNADLDQGLGQFQMARNIGELSSGETIRLVQSIGDKTDRQDVFKFNVTQNMNVSIRGGLGGAITGEFFIVLYHDMNGNEVIDGDHERIANSQESGFADRTISEALVPGDYYIYLQMDDATQAQTNYALTVQNVASAADTTPPSTPVLDKADVAFAGTQTLVDFHVIFSDDVGVDPTSVQQKGYLVFFPPAGNGIIKTPSSVTVSGKSVIAHYSHTFPAFATGQVQIRLSNQPGFETLVKDLAGNPMALPGGTPPFFGTYRAGTLPADSTIPTSALRSAPNVLVPNSANFDFVVAYGDNRGINLSTLDGSDILLDGPVGSGISNLPAAFVGSLPSSGGGFTYATYRITPPGGAWDYTDNGFWKIKLAASQVRDVNNNFAAANANAGTFLVHVPIPGDANNDNVVDHLDFNILHANFAGHGRGVPTGDVNYDGIVNFADFQTLERMFGTSKPLASEAVLLAAARSTKPAATKVFSMVPVSRPVQKPPVRKSAPLKR